MEQHQVFRDSKVSESNSVLHGTMTPTNAIGVFLVTVLGIMNEQVHISGKGVPGSLLASQGKPRYPKCWLVVSEIGECGASRRKPVANGRARVADKSRRNMKLPNVKVTTRYFMQEQTAGQLSQPHGKERGGEVAHQAFLETEGWTRWSPDVDFARGVIQGGKEP